MATAPINLDDVETIATEMMFHASHFGVLAEIANGRWTSEQITDLVRVLLAVLPVVRAAEVTADRAVRYGKPPGDWACEKCRPESDMLHLSPGFRCWYHGLLDAIDKMREAMKP